MYHFWLCANVSEVHSHEGLKKRAGVSSGMLGDPRSYMVQQPRRQQLISSAGNALGSFVPKTLFEGYLPFG
jgi:hypothetical protein